MKKLLSLVKASLHEGMNLFKINTKKNNTFNKILLPIILSFFLMSAIFSYSETIILELEKVNMAFVILTLFIIFTSFMTLIEGIYKAGSLLFNSKDDNLLLSLPISKSTVLFIRVFKFYLFELLYNSVFLIPAIVSYAIHVKPDIIYYLISLIGLFLFPIIPILLSSIIGALVTYFSSKFKGRNYVSTILIMILLLGIMYFSFNMENVIKNLTENASSINDLITKLYYPAGVYIELISSFSILKLLEFIIVHILIFVVVILLIGKVYFNINSSVKAVKTGKKNKNYLVKSTTQTWAIIKKDWRRFINSTVFITNAGFGLVLYLIMVIIFVIRYDEVIPKVIGFMPGITQAYIINYLPLISFGFICFGSFMTSITSSMISLEGKSFVILKSLPVKPITVIKGKILSAVLIMIPFILIGNLIMYIKFKFDIISIILTIILAILLPLLAETIGIIINLKYPKMDAKNDTEVVKQSMSSLIATFTGMGLLVASAYLLFKLLEKELTCSIILLIFLAIYGLIYILLSIYLNKTCDDSFNNIVV